MYDIIIIGAGASGMTAALNALRNGKKVLVLEQETFGGQIALSPRVENFPTIKEISGSALMDNLFEQIMSLGVEIELEKVIKVTKYDKIFTVETDSQTRQCKSVIIATGVKHKSFNYDNEEALTGNGISYCALCDGAFYSGEEVAIVGDGNTALQYAILLTNYCKKVYVYTLFDKFFGDGALVKTLLSKQNVEWIPNTAITKFLGENELEGFEYKDKEGKIQTHKIKALFVAIGQIPDNKRFENLVAVDKYGYIISDENCQTNCEGVFVAGDCRTKNVRQLTTAIADGAVSAFNACAYLDRA